MASTAVSLTPPAPPPTAMQAAIRAVQAASTDTGSSLAAIASGSTEGAATGGFVNLTV